MKLRVTDWKHAWFESHISDRFFQEMSKLERGSVQGLETSAQWMEQIMIEVGSLAQAMIRLEQNDAPEPQVRQAYEKSLRLAALSLHLITALDGADREQLRSASLVRGERGGAGGGFARMAGPQGGTNAAPEAAAPSNPPPAPAAAQFAGPRSAMPWRPPLAPTRVTQKTDPAPQADEAPQAPPTKANAPKAPAAASRSNGSSGGFDASMLSSLVQTSGKPSSARSESAAHQTILSLSQQGLSRAEIEAVTGEPRHIVEAVLKNARQQAQGDPRSA